MGLRSIDLDSNIRFVRALTSGVIVGFLGLIGGFYGSTQSEAFLAPLFPLLAAVLGGLFGFAVPLAIARLGGSVAELIHNPSGSSTPHDPEFSYPQSLAVRGEYAKAVAAYEECIEEAPENHEPYLRIARLLRDEWERPEEAARWFRRVRSEVELSVHRDLQVSRELIEVYTSRLGDPRRAAPELARLLDVHSDSPAAEWAREDLARIKALITEQETDD